MIVTNYLTWHARHRPTDAEGNPVWPRFGLLGGYVDAHFLLQCHYLRPFR